MTAAQCMAQLIIISKRLEQAAKEATKQTADEILKASTEKYCPVETGELKKSAKLEEENTGREYKVKISYNTEYAIYVHEIARYYHPHGQYKYLETPFNELTPKLSSNVESKLKGVI